MEGEQWRNCVGIGVFWGGEAYEEEWRLGVVHTYCTITEHCISIEIKTVASRSVIGTPLGLIK